MANHLVSRFFSGGNNSVYQTLDEFDRDLNVAEDDEDMEARLGLERPTNQENILGSPFSEQVQNRRKKLESKMEGVTNAYPTKNVARNIPRIAPSSGSGKVIDIDNDVPASLLVEALNPGTRSISQQDSSRFTKDGSPSAQAVPHTALLPNEILDQRWNQAQQQLNPNNKQTGSINMIHSTPDIPFTGNTVGFISPHQRAMYKWANVEDLDSFLHEVYDYYLGKGIYCICFSRLIGLMTVAFVVGFTIFMVMCIDYNKIPHHHRLSDVRVDYCILRISKSATLLLWIFCFIWIVKFITYLHDLRRLWDMHQFYHYLLDIPDMDMQTISWQDIVSKLMVLRDSNPITSLAATRKYVSNFTSKQRMDAHDIANRLMRKENYLIALFNKDILDLTIPLPWLRNQQLLTRTIEWNLGLAILDFVFHDGLNFNPIFLKESSRKILAKTLRTRFLVFGILNICLSPFIVVYLMLHYFFQYFNEYQKNPSAIGLRQYTPMAEWKFREFNELTHLFHRRMKLSYPFAARYLEQFPKEKTVQLSRFIAFVTGSFAAVLAIASLVDPELPLNFEITKDRTILFYFGVFGAIAAIARGMIPAETEVFDPAAELSWVMYHTRYSPVEWKGRLHSDEVKRDFAKLYEMKIVIFLWEVISIIITPFVLWFSLPGCSEKIIDFFREFTVHVDGIGYVCSFAEFDFNMTGTRKNNAGGRDEYYDAKDNKMVSSMVGFLENYSSSRYQGHGSRWGNTNSQNPGVLSPVQMHDGNATSTRRSRGLAGNSYQYGTQSAYRDHSSTLLDRHHLPTVSHARMLRQSVYQPTGHLRVTSSLQEEAEEDDNNPGHYISNLGDSFMSTMLDAEQDRSDMPTKDYEGGGVMDLLLQFQRAHVDTHGLGI